MTTETQNTNETGVTAEDQVEQVDELTLLKQRAKMMGITFSNNVGVAKLKSQIEEHLAGQPKEDSVEEVGTPDVVPAALATGNEDEPVGKPLTEREKLIRNATKLVRLRVTNLDPKKKDLPGEVITVANDVVGTIRKYVPFGEFTDEGYHVPHIIYEMLKERKFLSLRTVTNKNNPQQVKVEQRMVPEFALEVLEPLTQEELDKLAASQAAAGGVSD